MASLWSDLIDRCEVALNDNDNSVFTAEEIARWINDAVRDYSQHFPRIKTHTIAAAAATHTYDLNDDFQGVISVEYPSGEDPPQYLTRRSHTHAGFWTATAYYDIIPRSDVSYVSEIWISDDPAGTESIVVNYQAHHALIVNPRNVSGQTSVPQPHQQLLVKYVLWQAGIHLAMAEQQSPTSNSSLLMAQLAQNARRMEVAYHTAVSQAIYAADGRSKPIPWLQTGDLHTRIY